MSDTPMSTPTIVNGAVSFQSKDAPLQLWEYKGVIYASKLFRMHDQIGFSLTDSLIECKKRGMVPCLGEFRADALRAGWSVQKIEQVISTSQADSLI